MAKRSKSGAPAVAPKPGKPSSLLDTRVVYCGDNLEQLQKLPDACADLIDIDCMRSPALDPPERG